MSLAMSTEQEQLRSTMRRYLQERVPLTRVRELMATDEVFDRALWSSMAGDLGVQGMAIAEEYGGAGYGFQELTYAFEEFGRGLLPAPALATLGMALPALLASDDDAAKKAYLPKIAAGELVATVGWVAPGRGWSTADNGVQATQGEGAWMLSGAVSSVIDGAVADLILVLANHGGTQSLFAVTATDPGVRRASLPQLDQTRPLARIDLDSAPAILVGQPGDGNRILSAALDHANLLLAAEMVGGAQACLDTSVEYAKVREQFGRPIGSFQAVKHKCAEVLVALEGARAAVYYAGWAAADNPSELPVVAPLAKAAAAEAFFRAAGESIQIHGGIGFTWEHDAHLYFKRAEASSLMFGDVGAFRRELADRIGI